MEKNLFPDDLISLSDNSNQGTLLANRFYTINKADVDTAVRTRRQRVEERKRLEDEARWMFVRYLPIRIETGNLCNVNICLMHF